MISDDCDNRDLESIFDNEKKSLEEGGVIRLSCFIRYLEMCAEFRKTVYRGHSQVGWQLTPSLFRYKNLPDNEENAFKEIEAVHPEEFLKDNTTLERLVRMQHYGLPTRLLDVTRNPLVALYFAVVRDVDKDGEVIFIEVPEEDEKFFDSDTVSCIANLAHMPKRSKEFIKEELIRWFLKLRDLSSEENLKYCELLREILLKSVKSIIPIFSYFGVEDISKNYPSINNLIKCSNNVITPEISHFFHRINEGDNYSYEELEKDYKSFFNSYAEKIKNYFRTEPNAIGLFNEIPDIMRLIYFIREEKPYFKRIIRYSDLLRVIYVKTKQNNPRIIAQNGDFLLFGLTSNMNNYDDNTKIRIKTKITIKEGNKRWILRDLARAGITEDKLFPELAYTAKNILNKYTYQDE